MLVEKNYKIYGLVSSEFPDVIRYIGLTSMTLNSRLSSHYRDAKIYKNKRTNWMNKVIKNNHNISIILIEDNISNLGDVKNKEIQYIKLFKSFGANLVNGTAGGDYPAELDEKTKLRLSESRKRKVDQYTMFGEFIKTHNSIKEASLELKLGHGLLDASLRGESLAREFIFTYHKEKPKSLTLFTTRKERHYKPVIIVDILSKEELNFKYASDAAKFLKIGKTTMSRKLKSGKTINNKYTVKFYK